MTDSETYARKHVARALQVEPSQADADAFERVLRRLDDAELRGFMMACELYMMQRIANAAPKPDPIAP